MATSNNTCDGDCSLHFHIQASSYPNDGIQQQFHEQPAENQNPRSEGQVPEPVTSHAKDTVNIGEKQGVALAYNLDNHGFRRIIINFTPS